MYVAILKELLHQRDCFMTYNYSEIASLFQLKMFPGIRPAGYPANLKAGYLMWPDTNGKDSVLDPRVVDDPGSAKHW